LFDKKQIELQARTLDAVHEIIHLLKRRYFHLSTGGVFMITAAGTSGTITATYTVNGETAKPASPVVFSSDDPHASFTAIDDLNTTCTVAPGDPATSISIFATCGNPDGTTSEATPLVIQLTAQTQTFNLSIAQTA
jgi:hypothetical protein